MYVKIADIDSNRGDKRSTLITSKHYLVIYYDDKKFRKRRMALLNDNHSYVLEGNAPEAWEDRQKEISAHQAELARRENETLIHWSEQSEYVNGNWFRRLWLRIQYHLHDTRGAGRMPQIPDHIRIEIARCLLPDIIAFYESEEGQREFEEWKKRAVIACNEDYCSTPRK